MRRALAAAVLLLSAAASAAPPLTADPATEAAVAASRARALRLHKRLLIDLRADWCVACRQLDGIMQRPDVRAVVRPRYEVVAVDVGQMDRNLAIPARLGFGGRALFLPALIVVDPSGHRVVNHGEETIVANGRSLTPRSVRDRLTRWAE